jgi:hypothetical protein
VIDVAIRLGSRNSSRLSFSIASEDSARCNAFIARVEIMPVVPCRRLTLADALLLVAATAIGMALARWYATDVMSGGSFFDAPSLRTLVARLIEPLTLGVFAWTGAFLVIRLRRPRSSLRRLVRQPGMAAACGAVVGCAIAGLMMAIGVAVGSPRAPSWILAFGNAAPWMAGPAVIASTVNVALSGCRLERGWIDMLGCALGACWVALFVAAWIVRL